MATLLMVPDCVRSPRTHDNVKKACLCPIDPTHLSYIFDPTPEVPRSSSPHCNHNYYLATTTKGLETGIWRSTSEDSIGNFHRRTRSQIPERGGRWSSPSRGGVNYVLSKGVNPLPPPNPKKGLPAASITFDSTFFHFIC